MALVALLILEQDLPSCVKKNCPSIMFVPLWYYPPTSCYLYSTIKQTYMAVFDLYLNVH